MRRERGDRTGGALAVSLALHALVVGAMAFVPASDLERPKVKVYAVDIVSPPPNQAGDPVAAPLADQEPGPAEPAAAEPQPAAPQPEPPAPEPEPAPPREAPKEPAKAPAPTRTPERPKSETPRATPERPRTSNPTTTERPKTSSERPKSGGTETQKGSGSDANRTRGEGTDRSPATGRNPDASSPGGEGLTIRTGGVRCPSADYCNNVVRQVRRFFRAPASAPNGSGNVCFRIRRDGSVTRITAERVRGGAAFRIAMMEAAEQAGNRRAFGALPDAFDVEELPVCVEISPSTG